MRPRSRRRGSATYRVAWFANPLNPLVKPSSSDMPMSTYTLDVARDQQHHARAQHHRDGCEDQRPAHPAARRHHPRDHDAEAEERKQDEADRRRAQVRALLHPLARPVQGRVDAERDEGLAQVGALQRAVAGEHPHVDERARRAALPQEQRRREHDDRAEQPPVRRGETREEEEQGDDRAGEQEDAGEVERGQQAAAFTAWDRGVLRDAEQRERRR